MILLWIFYRDFLEKSQKNVRENLSKMYEISNLEKARK